MPIDTRDYAADKDTARYKQWEKEHEIDSLPLSGNNDTIMPSDKPDSRNKPVNNKGNQKEQENRKGGLVMTNKENKESEKIEKEEETYDTLAQIGRAHV